MPQESGEVLTLEVDGAGHLIAKSQVLDYQCRGHALQSYNMIDFFVDTYDQERKSSSRGADDTATTSSSSTNRGRPPNERVAYLATHPKGSKANRVIRSEGHNTLPNFIGYHTIPRSDDPAVRSYYCACMLILLKPWRNLATDLKAPDQIWDAALEEFTALASPRIRRMMTGFQYFHECLSAAQEDRRKRNARPPSADDEDDAEEVGEDVVDDPEEQELTEDTLAVLRHRALNLPEEAHGRVAVEQAKSVGIFAAGPTSETLAQSTAGMGTSRARAEDMIRLAGWKEQMENDIIRQNMGSMPPAAAPNEAGNTWPTIPATVEPIVIPTHGGAAAGESGAVDGPEASLTAVNPAELKVDQRRAYDIITWHLEEKLAGREVPPLRMIIYGEGGTGKSKVIQTVTARFAELHAQHTLTKAAYTGVAASLIDGKTTHSIAGMAIKDDGVVSDEAKAKLAAYWSPMEYLILDEYSMLSRRFLAALSRNIGIGKQQRGESNAEQSFGGLSVILTGDHHQFPPVAAETDALFYPARPGQDKIESIVGRTIFEEFREVVVLKEQMRISDPVWRSFLTNLRHGQVQQEDLTMLRNLIITNPVCPPANFDEEPWSGAALVTPRHGVRRQWNDQAVRKHCAKKGVRRYTCTAEDTVKERSYRTANIAERHAIVERSLTANMRKQRGKMLPDTVELAIGMKVLVTTNLATDLDLANGAKGEIVNIIFHPDEPAHGEDAAVHLKYLPICILVKMERTRATQLAGLADRVVPIEPQTMTMRIKVRVAPHKYVTRTARRRQFPMVASYAYTDYRSQGQTIAYVIVDIAKPPKGRLTLFNLYVALSRSSGRETIRLLRDFEDEVFLKSHAAEVQQEDDRLESLNENTRKWWEVIQRTRRAAQDAEGGPSTAIA